VIIFLIMDVAKRRGRDSNDKTTASHDRDLDRGRGC
jgi:hypothetical protein